MTYHLTGYAPWEGFRVAFNGSEGRLELLVKENQYAVPAGPTSAVLHGGDERPQNASVELVAHRFWQPAEVVELPPLGGGHGGGDERMLEAIFGDGDDDPLGRGASEVDGALSLVTGLAANASFETGSRCG